MLILLAALTGCAPKAARLEVANVHSEKLHRDMGFSVLRAPRVGGVDPATVPVILFLHGMGSDHLALDEFGVSESLHRAMAAGEIPPAHLVLPNGERGFYVNWYDGSNPYEDYILFEVLPEAEAYLGVGKGVSRHIAGVSMGGIGALQMGLRHPEMFETVTCISSVILTREEANEMMASPLIRMFAPVERIWGDGTDRRFSDGINPFKLAAGLTTDRTPRFFLASGDRERERIRSTTWRFRNHLDRLGLPYRVVTYKGEHNWYDWTPVIKEAIVLTRP